MNWFNFKKMAAIMVVVTIIALIYAFNAGGWWRILQRSLPLNVKVTNTTARTGFVGSDFTVWIDVTVYNSGGQGTITVWATVLGGGSWTKSKTINVDERQSKNITLEFMEPDSWSTSSGSYTVWIG